MRKFRKFQNSAFRKDKILTYETNFIKINKWCDTGLMVDNPNKLNVFV